MAGWLVEQLGGLTFVQSEVYEPVVRGAISPRNRLPDLRRQRGIGFEQQSHPWHWGPSFGLHEGAMPGSRSGLQTAAPGPGAQIRARRSRRAFPITETELHDMAAAAIIGDSKRPKAG